MFYPRHRPWKAAVALLPLWLSIVATPLSHALPLEDFDTSIVLPPSQGTGEGVSPLQQVLDQLRRGDSHGALARARQLNQTYPDIAATHELLGTVLLVRGDGEAAAGAFERALATDAGQYTARLKLATLRRTAGDERGAARLLRQGLHRSEDADAALYQRLGDWAVAAGDAEAAVGHYRLSLNAREALPVRVALARIYALGGFPLSARELLDGAVPPDVEDPDAQLVYGVLLFASGELSRAARHLEAAANLAPESPLPPLYLGAVQRHWGRLDESRRQLERHVSLAPQSAQGHAELGETLFLLNRDELAQAHFQRAEALGHTRAPLYKRLGDLRARQGDEVQAEAYYRRALALDDVDHTTAAALADLYRRQGLADRALEVLQAFVERFPERPGGHYALGQHYRQVDRPELALTALERSLDLAPGQPTVEAEVAALRRDLTAEP